MDLPSDSLGGALGAAFELRPTTRRRSSTSSSISSSLDLSSTDDDFSVAASPRDSSWNSIDIRDPFSASAKPVDGLKLYSLPDVSSCSPPRDGVGRVPPGEVALTLSEAILTAELGVATRLRAPGCTARLPHWLVAPSTRQFGFLRRSIGTPFSRMQSTKRMEILISRKNFKFLAYYLVLRTFQTLGLDFRVGDTISMRNSHIFPPV